MMIGELTVDQAVELVRRIEGQKHCGVAKDEEIKQEQMSSKSGSRRGKIPGTKVLKTFPVTAFFMHSICLFPPLLKIKL